MGTRAYTRLLTYMRGETNKNAIICLSYSLDVWGVAYT